MVVLSQDGDISAVIQASVQAILEEFEEYQTEFKRLTRLAKQRFETRDGRGAQTDAVERLDLYARVIRKIVSRIHNILGEKTQTRPLWAQMKAEYFSRIAGRHDIELAETFFNSLTRRIFTTVGVDPGIEFVTSDFEAIPNRVSAAVYHAYCLPDGVSLPALEDLVLAIYHDYPFQVAYQAPDRDAALVATHIAAQLEAHGFSGRFDRIELIQNVFYRNNCAYLVGRVCTQPCETPGAQHLPLVLCLVNTPGGILTDAVLMDEDDVSILFSFTRSYFHVEVERPHEMVGFLKTILPRKRPAELYISIGYNKHGKTELYRDLTSHLAHSQDQFKIAPGERGMVMVVFSLDSYDMVFKVIKDQVDPPKTTSRQEVMARYDLVFKHDRAGRLVDAQEFEYLRFDRARFSEDLLALLLKTAPSMVSVDGDCVVIKHLYTERRMAPLNLFVRAASEAEAADAVIDYGKAIKDLAATNIFPGDVLLKNFGVTRHGRVVFYDYDELCLVTDCKFRKLPAARNFDDEFEAEPWFYVGPMDIFPEEFSTFLGLPVTLRAIFEAHHGDLFGVDFWRGLQRRHQAGEIIDIYPYPENRRLDHSA